MLGKIVFDHLKSTDLTGCAQSVRKIFFFFGVAVFKAEINVKTIESIHIERGPSTVITIPFLSLAVENCSFFSEQ